jgi:hypothetical protein
MRLFEEVEELRRLERELAEILNEDGEPQALGDLGWDHGGLCFRGRRVA